MKTESLSHQRPTIIGLLIIAVGLATVTGWEWHQAKLLSERVAELEAAPTTTTTPAAGNAVLLEKLLAERDAANAKLRAELAARKSDKVAPLASLTVPPAATDGGTNSWLERIRSEDPARYKQIQEAREQRRQAVADWFNGQYARLDDRLQAAQTKEEGDLVSQIADALQHVEELSQRWQEIRSLPEDERRAAAGDLGAETRDAYKTLSDLRAQDRQMQLQQLAQQVGYRDATSAGQFVESVTGIIKETEVNPMRGMGWGGGRGPGGANTPAQPQP